MREYLVLFHVKTPEMTCLWFGRGRMFLSKGIHRERAAAGQVQMSDAGSNALVEVPIGNMPRGHLLLHNAAAWPNRCTFTSLYIHPDSQASFVAFPPGK